jgi:hypothetical protein
MSFLRWVGSTLAGNVVGFELFVALPVFLVGLRRNYTEWTPEWTLHAAFLTMVIGAVAGGIFWCLTAPFRNRRPSPHSPPSNNRWRGP